MTFTGETVKFENGKTFGIHSKMTKKGIRYYMYTRDRMIPISRKRINENICLD